MKCGGLLIVAIVLLAESSAAALELPEKYPVEGQQTIITLDAPVDQIVITYQPAAPIARIVVLPTNGQLQVPWEPERAGVVSIQAGTEIKKVSVRFSGTPVSGVLIFLFAGLVLFGGASVCLRALFAGPSED
ncbi:MAG TPA: hypothetical protein VML75_18300 [Kofleriaceae bacterium]|nr:hypothetical protein [Kofleriaceae bacterium]